MSDPRVCTLIQVRIEGSTSLVWHLQRKDYVCSRCDGAICINVPSSTLISLSFHKDVDTSM